MQIIPTAIAGLVEVQPRAFVDERGYFFELFNDKVFEEQDLPTQFPQDNQSFSKKGVIRGLHLQLPPYEQGKLVKVMTGKVLDVVVDLRPGSATFGQHEKVLLSSEKNNLLWVPEGFAHGFVALEDSIFYYKCTNNYNKQAESGIRWNDPDLNIDWGIEEPLVSEKDQELPSFKEFVSKWSLK
jgi:dTDP-4-dehydrorhamnose 3,5-epimerase